MAVEFVLEEMGVPYRAQPVDMAAGEHRSEEYLKLNSTGQVPALALPDGRVIGESVAIILTLGDRHPETALVTTQAEANRPIFLRWLIYMAASPYMTFVQFNHPERFLDAPETHQALIDNARHRLQGHFGALDTAISGSPFFLGSEPTALDFYLYMLVAFFSERDHLLAGRGKLRHLVEAVGERQSVRRVMPRHLN